MADIFLELKEKKFDTFPKKKMRAEPSAIGATEEEENGESPEAAGVDSAGDYDYLLSMSIGSFTLEKMQDLTAEKDNLVNDVEVLMNTAPKSLWLKDLDTLVKELDVLDQMDLADEKEREYNGLNNTNKGGSNVEKHAAKQPMEESNKEDDSAERRKASKKANGAVSDDQNKKQPKKRGSTSASTISEMAAESSPPSGSSAEPVLPQRRRTARVTKKATVRMKQWR